MEPMSVKEMVWKPTIKMGGNEEKLLSVRLTSRCDTQVKMNS